MHSFADITDTCMVEKAITEKNEALKMAQQMRLEFVSGISIELKEPLNVLVGFSELLLSQSFGILNDKQTKYCQCLLGASNQLHLLINNLLEMVSIDIDSSELDLSTFLVKDVLDEIIQNLEKRILEKNIDLIKNYSDHFIEFIGDRTRIKQSIYNMLIAAIRNAMFHGKIEVILAADDKNLKIIIKDDGVAVSAEENKISQRVFRRSPKFQRFGKMEKSGISMPLVRSLIELHGGTLKINSVALEGTSFVCTLPLPPKNSVGLEVNPSKDTYLLQAVNS
jgi:signal transduction histidine kinase